MSDGIRLRILVVGVVVVSLFAALFARLWFLQVINEQEYAAAAEGNRVRTVPEEAPRGRILDRRGRILVDNRTANVVAVSRSLVGEERGEREAVIANLSDILRIPVEELNDRLEDFRYADFRPIPVATEVPESTLVAIREREDELPGVEATQTAVRVYPHNVTASHVLGYVGEINDQELEDRRDEGYRLGSEIGKVGVERAYETDLRGTPGVEFFEVDRTGDVIRPLGVREPQQGHDVQLGVDLDVQRAAENALQDYIELARENGTPATGGAVVAMDVTDGSIVTMASYPTFDPSNFIHGITNDLWEELNDPENNLPLNNRAIQGLYPAASTFKIITALAGLRADTIDLGTTIEDRGSVEIGDRIFRNAGGRSYGTLGLSRALTVSSDVFFYTVAKRIDDLPRGEDEAIQETARLFGFGEPTGVELPFEQEGRVPDEDWKRRVNAANAEAFPEGRWFTGDTINLSIGQGDLLVTPLQLATAYSALANGGTVWRPHIGARIIDRFGSVVREVDSQAVREVPISPDARSTMLTGLRGVTANEEGTAHAAFAGYSGPAVAGKTGTGEIRGSEDLSLFVGLVPADAPRYAVVAVVEEGGFGSAIAAPIVRRVIDAINATESNDDLPPVGTLIAPTPTTTETEADGSEPVTPSTAVAPREPEGVVGE